MGVSDGVAHVENVIGELTYIGARMAGGGKEIDEGTANCPTVCGIVHVDQRGLHGDENHQSNVQGHFPRKVAVEGPLCPGGELEFLANGETVDGGGRVHGGRAGAVAAGAGAGAVEPEGHDDVEEEMEEETGGGGGAPVEGTKKKGARVSKAEGGR